MKRNQWTWLSVFEINERLIVLSVIFFNLFIFKKENNINICFRTGVWYVETYITYLFYECSFQFYKVDLHSLQQI